MEGVDKPPAKGRLECQSLSSLRVQRSLPPKNAMASGLLSRLRLLAGLDCSVLSGSQWNNLCFGPCSCILLSGLENWRFPCFLVLPGPGKQTWNSPFILLFPLHSAKGLPHQLPSLVSVLGTQPGPTDPLRKEI